MPSSVVDAFVKALASAETARDAGAVARLFAEDAELSNMTAREPRRGREGASEFWAAYLHSFGQIRSHIGHVVEADGTAVLEWTSDGTLPGGRPVHYRGVSILETDGNQVRRFRTYYDTAALHPDAGPAHFPTTDEWGPDAVRPTPELPGGTSVEQINRETQPRTPDGQVIDPKQEEVRDTAG